MINLYRTLALTVTLYHTGRFIKLLSGILNLGSKNECCSSLVAKLVQVIPFILIETTVVWFGRGY